MTESIEREQLALVTHEVRSPTAALAAIVGAARSPIDDATLRRLVDLSLAACRSIDRILGDAALGSLQLEEIDVVEVVRDAVASARLGGARLRTELDPDVPHVVADPVRLRQALDNLVANAVSAGGAAGEIVVAVRATGQEVIVTVADNGSGIPVEDHARIFEPGVRLDSTPDGSGLGLAIVRAVAEAHGGTVTVESAPGEGAAFSVALPIGGDQPAGTASSS
jgi:two-component system, OmpR family, sensor histidine kinase BaeS